MCSHKLLSEVPEIQHHDRKKNEKKTVLLNSLLYQKQFGRKGREGNVKYKPIKLKAEPQHGHTLYLESIKYIQFQPYIWFDDV